MALTTRPTTDELDEKHGNSNPQRPYRGEIQSFNAGTDGLIIDFRGYGLLGVVFPAFTTAVTMTFKVGLKADLSDGQIHNDVSITISAAGAVSISDLAEWPFIQPILNAADTDDVGFALT